MNDYTMSSKTVSVRIGVFIIVFACSSAAFLAAYAAKMRAETSTLQVTIDSGTLEGVRISSIPYGAAFLGIPYAAQPVGKLRWRVPELPPHWQGIRDAKQYGPACPQAPSPWLPEMLGRKEMATDEACLYLNVWTPKLSAEANLPVMVWVHGGGNVEGSGEWPPLGETLAAKGVVVVSINYRLGVFGFFASSALSAESLYHVSGNYGQLDQIGALQWVQRNIRRFGGDPNRVTIAGQSSGALDICNVMASPLAAKLFQRVILQSGVCVDSIFPSLAYAETNGLLLAQDLGVQHDSQLIERLRALPEERLLKAANQDERLDLEPVVDGWFLREQPAAVFAEGRQANVPVIVGTNEDEVSIFASPIVGGKSYRPQTVREYRQWLQGRFHSLADVVFEAYPVNNDAEVPLVFRIMDTDFDFGFGAWLLAGDTAHIRQRAFLYHFTYVGTGIFSKLGAFHSEESMFLSGKYWTSWIKQPEDAALSDAIIGYWVQFVRTGNPNVVNLPAWPVYDPKSDIALGLGKEIGPLTMPRSAKFRVFKLYLIRRLQQSSE